MLHSDPRPTSEVVETNFLNFFKTKFGPKFTNFFGLLATNFFEPLPSPPPVHLGLCTVRSPVGLQSYANLECKSCHHPDNQSSADSYEFGTHILSQLILVWFHGHWRNCFWPCLGRFRLVRLGEQRSHTPEAPEGVPQGLTAYLALFLFEFLFLKKRASCILIRTYLPNIYRISTE